MTSAHLDSHSLQSFMEHKGVVGEIIHCPAPTPTVEAAAQAMGVTPIQIVKTLLFLISGQPVAVIACGTQPVDRRPIADRFGVGRKQVKLADAETVLTVTGYPAGTVPPFGHRSQHLTLIDPRVIAQRFVYAGGGEEDALVGLDPAEIVRATGAEILAVLESSAPENGEGA